MKRRISAVLALFMALSLSACGNGGSTENQSRTDTVSETQTQNSTDEDNGQSADAGTSGQQTASGSNILVAYFSFPLEDGVDSVATASRTRYDDGSLGNTNFIANLIRNETGGDLFPIEVEDGHYPTDDFEELAEIAQEEINDGDRPAMKNQIENFDNYDTVFVGYPIWWYDMPAVMYSFFDEYDFSGKTIIPFTTHGGSRLSGTPETIAELEPDATVSDDAFTVSRNDIEGAASEVSDWVASLDLGQ